MPHPRHRLVADRERDVKIIAPAVGLALLQIVVSVIVVSAFVFTVLLRTDAGVAPQALMLWTIVGAYVGAVAMVDAG